MTARHPQLRLDYRPSEPTGWPASSPEEPVGTTIGGHTTATGFTLGGTDYRVRLLQPDPVYLSFPADAGVAFRSTLAAAFGAHYSLRYVGGLPPRERFEVRSYTVFTEQPAPDAPITFGAEIFVVHRGDDPPADRLRWIQVVRWTGGFAPAGSFVDNGMRANPFRPASGTTSVDGRRQVNLPVRWLGSAMPDQPDPPADRLVAEAFLVLDEGRSIAVLGGVGYGWEVVR